jgi:predicted TIM-barrel fold metal-dependent hydrolase
VDITDAYGHCGLRKYKPVEDVRAIMQRNGVVRAVLAQHLGEYDNSYIEGIVAAAPRKFAGVFLVDLASERAADDVTRWTRRGVFRGIRMPAESLATQRALWQWAAHLRLNFVVYGAIAAHARELGRFARENAQSVIQIAHLAFPVAAESPAFNSTRPALALAEQPNVVVQISGMHSSGVAPYENLVPWIRMLHSAFGATRLVYGSNFPVMKEDSVYSAEIDLIRRGQLGIPERAAEAVLNSNAVRVWFSGRSAPRSG